MTLTFAALFTLAGTRTLAAQSDAPAPAAVTDADSVETDDSIPADSSMDKLVVSSEPDHPRQAQGEEHRGHRKNRRHHGEGDGARIGGGEGNHVRPPRGSETPRHATGGGDKPRPNR